MLTRSGVKMEQVKVLGVAIGPGSFTALRVGLSFIKGMALALALPVVGVNTLDVVAASQAAGNLPLACLLPAGRTRHAVGWYHTGTGKKSVWQPMDAPSIMTIEALAESISQECVICGDLNASERQILKRNGLIRLVSPALSTRRPAILAELAFARWQAGSLDEAASLAPIYLHLADPIPADSSGTFPVESSGTFPVELSGAKPL